MNHVRECESSLFPLSASNIISLRYIAKDVLFLCENNTGRPKTGGEERIVASKMSAVSLSLSRTRARVFHEWLTQMSHISLTNARYCQMHKVGMLVILCTPVVGL